MVEARDYHERTKHTPQQLRETDFRPDPETKPVPYKEYVDLPTVDLPSVWVSNAPTLSVVAERAADPLAGTEQPAPTGIDRETLATLCYEAAGVLKTVTIDGGRELDFRAASCTGKLYHVNCYLVCGGVEDLDSGVYHFDPRSFQLERLRDGDYRQVLARTTGELAGTETVALDDEASEPGITDAPVSVVLTSTWWRNAWNYRDRTYRHAFWDTGTVVANLLATAHALDYRGQVVAGFADETVVELLGVDPAEEAPIALVPIGSDEPCPDAPAVDPIDPETVLQPDHDREHPLIADAWRVSTLPDGDEAASWRSRCLYKGTIGTQSFGAGERIALEPVDHESATARPLHATIYRRGSCRDYAVEGPSSRQVATVLDRALRGVPADWNGGVGSGLRYSDVYVRVSDVDGIPDGAYHYDSTEYDLERLDETTDEEMTHIALDQEWAGDAHCNVYLLADVDAIVGRLGDRGYRLAQLEAGVTLGRLYLATYAHRDLGGTGLTFFDDLVTETFSPRAAGQTPTCTFAFGKRAE